jgi:hypothetical protein
MGVDNKSVTYFCYLPDHLKSNICILLFYFIPVSKDNAAFLTYLFQAS